MSNPNYRPLLPATQPRPPPARPPPKRVRISSACDACRTKRTRCDGGRPTCAACTERSSECTYTKNDGRESRPTALKEENSSLNAKVAAFNDIVNLLKRMSPEAAQHALHRLSTGSDPVAMLKTLRGEPVQTVDSDEDTARSIFPAANSRCELELLVRHPIAYQALDMPSRAKSLRLHLSQFYSPPSTPSLQSTQTSTSLQGSSLFENSDNVDNFQSDLDPRHAQPYFDHRLAELHIDFWTSVSLPREIAAESISRYLEVQHPVWGLFDAWLFVRDLVQFKFDYCSPFMLNAVLAAALQFYTVVDPEAAKYSLACEKEAEALYKAETSLKSLPTLSGLAILHVSMTCHGEGNRGTEYLIAAIEAAKEIKLFGVPDALNTLNSDLDPGEALVATSATAWGLFNMAVHQSRFFSNTPIISFPPALPHPGDPTSGWKPDRSDKSDFYSIIERRMTNMDQVLSAFSRFWTVVNEVLQVYRNPENIGITLAFALSKYSKLLGLVDKLPKVMVDEARLSNHAFMFL
ncbi:hypothetical protein BS50DRAFT_579503 [Corynespora cassiicola Philippines]|uniref:Zn(2)-C6 fungal-type domain-containing protein n=1 Tax=Corynespora cassiicola Philippines TaxID=1448308 RepID=A0A2T2N3H0_CORCC|nr:hypothetical protein BS50DRAFT_579503 [Corynespora cassiicola Philippines]